MPEILRKYNPLIFPWKLVITCPDNLQSSSTKLLRHLKFLTTNPIAIKVRLIHDLYLLVQRRPDFSTLLEAGNSNFQRGENSIPAVARLGCTSFLIFPFVFQQFFLIMLWFGFFSFLFTCYKVVQWSPIVRGTAEQEQESGLIRNVKVSGQLQMSKLTGENQISSPFVMVLS